MNHELKHQNQTIEFFPTFSGYSSRIVDLDQRCRALFQSAYFRGMCQRLWRRLLHQPYRLNSLPSLKDETALQNSRDEGMHNVDLRLIVGSLNLHQDFDINFSPIRERCMQRWVRIASMYITAESVPAVELIQVNGHYLVLDGHHRISVARALGMKFIDAHVRKINVQVHRCGESRLSGAYAS